MTARDTYAASVATAVTAKAATNLANATVAQETIAASGVNVGYTIQAGNFANLDSATRNSNAAYAAAKLKAEMVKQVAVQAAKDILRETDTHPA